MIKIFKNFRINHNSTNKKGFTVAELLLVALIIGFITAIGINTYRVQREQFQFTESLTKFGSLINTARNYATTSRAVYDPSKDTPSFIPREGYGVYINREEGKVILFANIVANGSNENIYDLPSDIIEETYILPNISSLDAILNENGDSIGNEAVIIFRPPLGEAFLGNNIAPDPINELRFQFVRRGEDFSKTIKINRVAGFPEVMPDVVEEEEED